MAQKELLELRKSMKAKKPKFLRSSCKIKARVSNNWRKPKGLQNKMRLNLKGYRVTVNPGYGSPIAVKHLDYKTGLLPVRVSNKNELEKIDIKTQGIIIASTVGARKKLEIINIAEEKNIIIIQNAKKIKDAIANKLDKKRKAKAVKIEKKKAKDKKQKKAEKKKEEKVEKKENKTESAVHDNIETKKAVDADKVNKEILQKRI
jgi:large subunit ribosomal protein L32e